MTLGHFGRSQIGEGVWVRVFGQLRNGNEGIQEGHRGSLFHFTYHTSLVKRWSWLISSLEQKDSRLRQGTLTKGKALYSWPPCTFDTANIIYFFTNLATLVRRSTVLSLPLQLVFPGLGYTYATFIEISRFIANLFWLDFHWLLNGKSASSMRNTITIQTLEKNLLKYLQKKLNENVYRILHCWLEYSKAPFWMVLSRLSDINRVFKI